MGDGFQEMMMVMVMVILYEYEKVLYLCHAENK